MVSVETEALRAVKSSLSDFQTDIEGMSVRANKDAEDIRQECHVAVDKLKKEVKSLETQIADLTKRIEALEISINNTTAEINSISDQILYEKSNIHSLSGQISSLNSQISSLRSQLSNAEDEQKEQLQAMISSLEDDVRSCQQRISDLKVQIDGLEKKKSGCQEKLRYDKGQKAQYEMDLAKAKKRHNRMQNQLDRLITAFNHVASDLQSYVSAAKKFENRSGTDIQSQQSAVESCIESIETYLSVSI